MPTARRIFLVLLASVAIATGAAMSQVWTYGRRQRRGLERFQTRVDIERLESHIKLLVAWFARSKYRPRYTRQEWIRNLEYATRWGLSAVELARDLRHLHGYGVSAAQPPGTGRLRHSVRQAHDALCPYRRQPP